MNYLLIGQIILILVAQARQISAIEALPKKIDCNPKFIEAAKEQEGGQC